MLMRFASTHHGMEFAADTCHSQLPDIAPDPRANSRPPEKVDAGGLAPQQAADGYACTPFTAATDNPACVAAPRAHRYDTSGAVRSPFANTILADASARAGRSRARGSPAVSLDPVAIAFHSLTSVNVLGRSAASTYWVGVMPDCDSNDLCRCRCASPQATRIVLRSPPRWAGIAHYRYLLFDGAAPPLTNALWTDMHGRCVHTCRSESSGPRLARPAIDFQMTQR